MLDNKGAAGSGDLYDFKLGTKMFEWFKQKSEVRKLIDRVGIEEASRQCAEIVSKKIPSPDILHQFVLEELDAARLGNVAAREFARNSGIPAAEYVGALGRSRPEVDGPNGPQQELLRICFQLGDDTALMARFRISIVQKLMTKAGRPEASTTRQISFEVRTEGDVERLVREQGVEEAGRTLRKLAHEGNLMCQIALSQFMLVGLEKYKSAELRRDCETFTKLAAEQGHAGSQFNLAKLYMLAVDISDGYVNDNDYELIEKAKFWHRKAAAQRFQPSIDRIKEIESDFPDGWFQGAD